MKNRKSCKSKAVGGLVDKKTSGKINSEIGAEVTARDTDGSGKLICTTFPT